MADYFRVCSTCKKEIGFEQEYLLCSVSTCNRKRTGLFFCSVECWDAHLPMMRHREAWAEKARSPTREQWEREQADEENEAGRDPVVASGARHASESGVANAPARRIVSTGSDDAEDLRDVLVVVSKLKKYIKARSGMNTSDSVVDVLSDHLRSLSNEAIRNAARDGRKTVLDRDFAPLLQKKP